jgi:uncharacterized protein YdeI (YjbR/CyaY-like superfamily)
LKKPAERTVNAIIATMPRISGSNMTPIFFKSQVDFRKWFEKNHEIKTELLVGFYKKATGKPTMTWSQSVDEALCFGWIDGIRRSIDEESYCIRFTPRKPASNWSRVNINKVRELSEKGMMKQSGLDAFNNRKDHRSGIYSFENEQARLHDHLEKMFMDNKKAWEFFTIQAPSYRKTIIHWVMSAKQEVTRINRLTKLIAVSEEHKRIY